MLRRVLRQVERAAGRAVDAAGSAVGRGGLLDGLEAGADEVLADELTQHVKLAMTATRPSYLPQPA